MKKEENVVRWIPRVPFIISIQYAYAKRRKTKIVCIFNLLQRRPSRP